MIKAPTFFNAEAHSHIQSYPSLHKPPTDIVPGQVGAPLEEQITLLPVDRDGVAVALAPGSHRSGLPDMFYAEETHAAIVDQATFARTQEKLAAVADAFSYRAKATRSAFSGMIVCDQCGQKYKRTKNHGRYIWNCSTYLVHGKGACPGLQIREDILQQAAALALGLSEYDETVFESRIQQVRAKASHELTFIFQDGGKLDVPWKKAPRGESWTPEMKAAAAERTRRQRRKQ